MKNLPVAIFLVLIIWFFNLTLGSFLLDPGLLIFSGCVIVYVSVRFLYKKYKFRKFISLLSLLTILIFYLGSLSLYFNVSHLNFLYKLAAWFPLVGDSPSGFNFMINSGVFNFPYVKPADAPFCFHLIAGFIFTTYPVWLYLGVRLGYILFGKNEYQTGVISLLL